MGKRKLHKILVIDDDEDILRIVKIALKQFELRCASTGEAGTQETIEFHPDLILLDISLPDIDGREIAKRLQNDPATSKIPIIFMSGEKVQERMIQKPFNPLNLESEVRRIWEECA